ncbi:SusC/RagA family TonB-linked outer membrane protein [Arenibacter lacus]|uniref:SusC/RagA family TonB-linked outer membrane protein n=1 Tax=Arenibacter lacus TaxID=2608629 RepID=UPI00123C998D|nr:SusC/RagA family TonB-linked outer membrane protein [Arenibacter lacus]
MKKILKNYLPKNKRIARYTWGFLMFIGFIQIAQAQDIKVTGVITDVDNNQPLPGASIIQKGTATGVVSNFDGEFSITVPSTAVLEISYIGYTTQAIPVNNRTVIDVALEVQAAALDEVVVTALGIKKQEKALGYAVQEVQGDILERAPEGNVLSNLTGQVAGLTVFNSTEFYDTPSISLRGESPLVVIDGVPVSTDFWNVSPNDIESITVLKGATASALYGSKGSGGAIMITTKKGATGKVSVNINSATMYKAGYVAIPKPQSVYGTGDNGQYRYGDGAGGGVNDAATYVWGPRMDVRDPSTPSGWKEIAQWDSPIDPVTGERIPTPWVSRGKNNLKNFLGSEYITTNNINVSQSGEKGSFRVSATHVYQKGQVPNTQLNNATFNLGGTLEISDRLNVDASLTYNKQYSPNIPTSGYTGNGYVYNLLVWSGTDFDIRDFKDYWLTKDVQQKYYQYTSFYNNPYFLAHENLQGYYQDGSYGYMTLNYDIMEGLTLTSRTGLNSRSVQRTVNFPISQGQGKGGYSESSNYDFTVNSDLLLNYDKEITPDLDLNAFVGGTLNYNMYKSLSASTDGLNVPGFYSLSNSANPVGASNYLREKQLNSVYGKFSLAYKSGLFLDLTGRNDWSSALPEETRSYFYPSAAFSGVISEFVNMPEAISFAKLRASWTLSKKDIDPYSIRPVYSVNSDVWAGQSTASYPGSIRGSNLKPEENRTYEFGADLRFFKSRLKLDMAYYNTLNYNFITNAAVSDASGFSSKTTNTDEQYEKKGYELTLGAQIIKKEHFAWDTQVNGSVYHWYWKQLDPDFSPQKAWVYPGARTDYIVAYDWERDPNGNVIHSNGFPVRSDYESALGHSEPNFVWGWNNTIRYNRFSLSFSFDGRIGGDMYSRTNQAMWNSGSHPESVNQYREAAANGINTYVGDGVIVTSGEVTRDEKGNITNDTRVFAPNATEVSYITYMKRYNPYIGNLSSQNIFDQTFVKLREATLNFNVPEHICEQIGASTASFGLVGRNLWLWTKEVKHVDPDWGADNLSSASHRNIGFNLKLSF